MAGPPFAAPLSGPRTTALIEDIIWRNVDYTGATFRLEVRDRRDGGQLRIGLNTVSSAASEGVRVIDVQDIDGVPQTTLGIRINESTMEGIPNAIELGVEPGEDVTFTWGLHITPVGGLKFLAFEGLFILKASTPA